MALLNEKFDNLSLFYENSSTVIYKGNSKKDGKNVILKSHKNQDEIFRIKHEYDLLFAKEIAGATNVLGISYNDDKNYLVLEDSGAVVLDDYFSKNTVDINTFLMIAENAAAALATIHDQGIIHCDIKPENMLIHPETLQIWYIDFGISFSKNVRNSKIDCFSGTLQYMAPEQTGRLNMSVDTRSDLYSLGVTLYSLLTGAMPFTGENAVELIHAHTVLPPRPISEYIQVDGMISGIILKLMEKSQKKRYQSAMSLAYDLSICIKELLEHQHIEPFTLGEKDVFVGLEPGKKLYGKEKNLEDLKRIFHSTQERESSLVLLHGPSGSGKSSLLRVFEEYVEDNQGYLIRGSFDWKEDGELYSAIREAFEGFELYAYNANLPLPEYRTKLLSALEHNAQVLIDILPSFGKILGSQPPVLQLNAFESMQRARRVFQKLFEVICNAPYPFVFVFENIQWADLNSVSLLLSAVEGRDMGNCIMILTYRDEDTDFIKELTPKLQKLDKTNLNVIDIGLTHLDKEGIQAIGEEFFEHDSVESREIADILYNATGGVVSEVREYLQLMYRNKQIGYDVHNDNWYVDFEHLDQVVLLDMENRYNDIFNELKDYKQDALLKLSCFGENFSLSDASYVYDMDQTELKNTLTQLMDKNWISRNERNSDLYSFSYKTIFDLCYGKLSHDEAIINHQTIVKKLYEKYKDQSEEMLKRSTLFTRQIFIVGIAHFDPELVHDISRYKLIAAQKIMNSANMEQAAKIFQNGLKLLGDQPFKTDYKLSYELYLNYGMCAFALQEFEMANELFEIVLSNVNNEDDFYEAHYLIAKQYLSTAEWENARIYCERYLRAEGLLLSDDVDIKAAANVEFEKYLKLAAGVGHMVAFNYKPTTDKTTEYHGNMLILYADACLFSLDRDSRYYLYKAVNVGIESGYYFSDYIKLFSVAAARYAFIGDFFQAKGIIEAGLENAEKHKLPQAFLWCIYGNMISHWVNPLSDTLEIYKNAKHHALLEANAFYEAFADMMLLNYHSFVGENLEEYHRETQATLHNLQRNRLDALQANFTTFRQYARCLMGRTKGPDSFDDDEFDEESLSVIRGTWNGVFNDNFYYVYRLRALYIHGYYEEAEEYAVKYKELSKAFNFSAYISSAQYYYYYSMTLIQLCYQYPEKQEAYLRTVYENQKFLQHYATVNPENFELKAQMVNVSMQLLKTDAIENLDDLAMVFRGFESKGFVWDVIFTERQAVTYWQKRDIPIYVDMHRRNQLVLYKELGAKHLIKIFSDLDQDSKKQERNQTYYGLSTSHMSSIYVENHLTYKEKSQYSGINIALDFQALLKILEELITIDTLAALSNTLLKLLMENGNANKAMLLLEENKAVELTGVQFAVDADSFFNELDLPTDIEMIGNDKIPKKIIALALSKNETVVANAVRNEYRHMGDDYLSITGPESFLCMPVCVKEKTIGAIYMENTNLSGAFPDGRIRFLQAVILQAAALIQNLQNAEVMEEYTKDLEKRLSTYLGQQNALIAGIAHEINSPVGVCLTVSTKVYEKTVSAQKSFEEKSLSKSALMKYLEETKDGLNIINNNIMRAGNLVQNFKKMSVEQSTEIFENLELGTTIKNIIEYIRPGVKKKLDHVDLFIPDDLWVYTSSGVLAQIFTNLIMNSAIHAFEHMEKDQCKVEIEVIDMENRDEIEIRYSDNGKGVAEEDVEKIFQPFYTTKRNRGGSGLGCHIILTHVTQTLKGSIRCISGIDKGMTFIMRLPKHIVEEVKEAPGNEQ